MGELINFTEYKKNILIRRNYLCGDEQVLRRLINKFERQSKLDECNKRMVVIKREIKKLKNFKRWYKPLNYNIFSHEQIKNYINKYMLLLRIEVSIKRTFLKKL